jgi:hypothetical protein
MKVFKLGQRITIATGFVLISLTLQSCTQDYKVTQETKSVTSREPPGGDPGGNPGGPSKQTDTFQVALPGTVKTDILFVIDNSGSMSDEQNALASAFSSFITEFVNKGVDYHIGVISTDSNSYSNVPITNDPNNVPSPKPTGWFGNPFFGFHNPYPTAATAPGTLLMKNTYPATPNHLRPASGTTQQIIDMFKANAKLGTSGSGNERVIYNALQAVDVKKLANENSGFRREDALMAFVGVTDENESIINDAVLVNGEFAGSESTDSKTAWEPCAECSARAGA